MSKGESLTGEKLHHIAAKLAYDSQELSIEGFKDSSNLIVKSAIFNIFHEAIIIHQSIGELVYSGRSSSGAILARTILDLTVSLIAIVKSRNPNLAPFRYFNSNHRQMLRDKTISSDLRREIRDLIRGQIDLLSPEDKPKAYRISKEKDRAYWFWEEWKNPSEIITNFASQHISEAYKQYSSASHGGFYGLKIFRDKSLEYDVNPRLPVQLQAVLVSVASSRYLISLTSLRSNYQNLGLEPICSKLIEDIETIEILKARLK